MLKLLVREDESKNLSRGSDITGSSRVEKLDDNDHKNNNTSDLYENLIIL